MDISEYLRSVRGVLDKHHKDRLYKERMNLWEEAVAPIDDWQSPRKGAKLECGCEGELRLQSDGYTEWTDIVWLTECERHEGV